MKPIGSRWMRSDHVRRVESWVREFGAGIPGQGAAADACSATFPRTATTEGDQPHDQPQRLADTSFPHLANGSRTYDRVDDARGHPGAG